MNYEYIAAPVLGGIIGLITNGIAIRMLFRPLEAIKLWGMTLPFTPGIIPKEKPRIARSVGEAVSVHLLNGDVLAEAMTSEDMLLKLGAFFDEMADSFKADGKTIEDVLTGVTGEDSSGYMLDSLTDTICSTIKAKAGEQQLGKFIGDTVAAKAKKKLDTKALGILGAFITDDMMVYFSAQIAAIVDEMITEHMDELLGGVIKSEVAGLLNMETRDVLQRFEHKLPDIKARFTALYKASVTTNIHRLVSAIDISKIIISRIETYDVLELERLILSIIRKELNAIILLGGVLGVLMGLLGVIASGLGR